MKAVPTLTNTSAASHLFLADRTGVIHQTLDRLSRYRHLSIGQSDNHGLIPIRWWGSIKGKREGELVSRSSCGVVCSEIRSKKRMDGGVAVHVTQQNLPTSVSR